MLLLQAKNISYAIGEREIFALDQLSIYTGDRIGLVGVNGAGKTTLVHVLAGLLAPDAGEVIHSGTLAVIEQMGEGQDGLETRQAADWAVGGGKSGGERMRARIAGALAQGADLLFADEPTSNLDEAGIDQVERALAGYPGAVVLISHDRALMDAVCTQVLELDGGKIRVYAGGFSDYWRQKELEREQQWEAYQSYTQKRQQLMAAASDQAQRAAKFNNMSQNDFYRGKSKQVAQKAKALRTRVEKLEVHEKPRERAGIYMDLQRVEQPVSATPLRVEGVRLVRGGRTLLEAGGFSLRRGEKLAIAGPNGCGKSTLLEHIVSGGAGVTLAPGVRIGYFAQNLDILDPEATALENVQRTSPHEQNFIRLVMARLWIPADEVFKKVKVLSGGERVKVALAKVYLSQANLLILDEPTNYLDIFATQALQEALGAYPGTVLLVSHDRMLREAVCARQLRFDAGRLEDPSLKAQPTASRVNELTLLRLKRDQVLSDLSLPRRDKDVEALETQFRQLNEQIRQLEAELAPKKKPRGRR